MSTCVFYIQSVVVVCDFDLNLVKKTIKFNKAKLMFIGQVVNKL